MEISSLDFDDPVTYSNYDPDFAEWKKVGQVALASFAFVACGAFVPALLKKRRAYSAAIPNMPPPVVELVAEAPVGPEAQRPILQFPRCTDIERPKVEEIFTIAAGGTTAITRAPALIRLGIEIDHIHPFAFLMAAPKAHVQTIFYRSGWLGDFLIGKVMGGVKKGMEREYGRNNLERYIPDFATVFTKDPERIRPLIQARSWRQLVHYLFEINSEHGE